LTVSMKAGYLASMKAPQRWKDLQDAESIRFRMHNQQKQVLGHAVLDRRPDYRLAREIRLSGYCMKNLSIKLFYELMELHLRSLFVSLALHKTKSHIHDQDVLGSILSIPHLEELNVFIFEAVVGVLVTASFDNSSRAS